MTTALRARRDGGDDAAAAARRETILQTATSVFLRFGFKKTSMDDLARAAGLSRQGLYLHFPTKEALFRDAALHLAASTRTMQHAALDQDDLDLEERLLGSFVAIYRHELVGSEHVAELLATARQLVGTAFVDAEQQLVVDLARALSKLGIAASWRDAGLSAKDLAQHLFAASRGHKADVSTPAEYRDRMRVSVRLVVRGGRR